MQVFFGTYTRRTSQGIYAAQFNVKTGQLSDLELIAAEPSPTYLAFSEDQFLYTVGAEEGKGGIAAFTPDFQLINHVVEEGAPLCYVSVDNERQLVYGANYHKGQILSYKKNADGSLTLADMDQHQGSGPHENQAGPHAHFADLTPDNFLVTCDLGTDQVITYDVDTEGKLTQIASYHSTAGAGPRHLVFHPFLKNAYLICELNGTIEVLIYDGHGEFERQQTISTLPDDFHDFNGTAAIRMTSDGRFLYASNRGHDSIAVYSIAADGTLRLIEIVPTHGKTPRDFQITPDQGYLIVAHQDSDNVTVFSRDKVYGLLIELSNDFTVPESVCVAFRSQFG